MDSGVEGVIFGLNLSSLHFGGFSDSEIFTLRILQLLSSVHYNSFVIVINVFYQEKRQRTRGRRKQEGDNDVAATRCVVCLDGFRTVALIPCGIIVCAV